MRLAESVQSVWSVQPLQSARLHTEKPARLLQSVRSAEPAKSAEPARLAEPTHFVLYRFGKTARTTVSAVSAVPEKARKVLDSWVWTIGAVCSVHTAAWAAA